MKSRRWALADEDDVLFARLSYLRDELNYLRAERDRTPSFEAFRLEDFEAFAKAVQVWVRGS